MARSCAIGTASTVKNVRAPRLQRCQLAANRREQRQGLGGEVLLRRLLVIGLEIAEEEHARLCHFLERLGPLALRGGDAFELRKIVRLDAQARELPLQLLGEQSQRGAHHVLLV